METKQLTSENTVLEFIEEIHRQTEKMCTAGPGPYGFGIKNENPSDIGMVINLEPSPVRDDALFPDDIPSYELSVQAFSREGQRVLELSEVEVLREDGNPATCKIAGAVIRLAKEPRHVTREECLEAFDVLADQELRVLEEPEEPQAGMQGQSLC